MAGTDNDPSIELPLSADWLPVLEAYRPLCSPLGGPHLAAKDLTDAMADNDDDRRVHSMRRCFARGIRRPDELLSASYWIEHWLDPRPNGVAVMEGFRSITTIKGYAFFVWKPDLAKIWPTIFAPTLPPPQPQPQKPPPEPEEWRSSLQAEFDRLPRSQKSAWVRNTAFPRMQAEVGDKAPWDSWESLRRAFYSGRRKKI